jgi:hypothetical protein
MTMEYDSSWNDDGEGNMSPPIPPPAPLPPPLPEEPPLPPPAWVPAEAPITLWAQISVDGALMGFWDTSGGEQSNLPPRSELIPLTEEQHRFAVEQSADAYDKVQKRFFRLCEPAHIPGGV